MIPAFFAWLGSITEFWEALLKLALAMIAGGVIGMERGKQGRAAGMRTHILVCLGATLTAMCGIFAFEAFGAGDPLRISAQVISGIGFLGVGTILIKGRFQITGLTTAAGLWTVGAIGIALGLGYYIGAAIAFILSVLATTLMARFEYKVTRRNTRFGIYIEVYLDTNVRKIINHLQENYPVTDIQVTPPRSGKSDNVGIECNVHAYDNANLTPATMSSRLEELEEVIYALESI